MPLPRKMMRDIKSLSGKVDRVANPYMAYMQITCLEMEKARKGHERTSALGRVRQLDARLSEIEREKASLLRALAERGAAPPARLSAGAERRLPARESANGFKLRY